MGDDLPSWEQYEAAVAARTAVNRSAVGGFAVSREEIIWEACKSFPCPSEIPPSPLALPLRIHISRGDPLGTNLTAADFMNVIIPRVNELWEQAGIRFELEGVYEETWSEQVAGHTLADIREQILSLRRNPLTGRMMGKELRKEIFVDRLIGQASLSPNTYDVWFFDMIGIGSQGCCVDRSSRTVIMGRRSTKGYPSPTERPLLCLGKTCAHELGHALCLGHPRGQRFRDGSAQDACTGRDNLMTGGADSRGGGGERLCPWQVLLTREAARAFLADLSPPL